MMFERYTEAARRTIFFARYEASQAGSEYIESTHLLLGLLRADSGWVESALRTPEALESLRKQLGAAPAKERFSTTVDLPLSEESKQVLTYAAEEAERLDSKHIDGGHLLLGILRQENSAAAKALRERGVALEIVRTEMAEGATLNAELHRLVDRLPPANLRKAARMLEGLATQQRPAEFWPESGPFSRFTEKARRVIFFARYEASTLGSPEIGPEHLLLGVLREDKAVAIAFLKSHAELEAVRKEIEQRQPAGEKSSTSLDLPLSKGGHQVAVRAREEAEAMGHQAAATPHLLLGVLRAGDWVAELLTKRGVTLEAVRQYARDAATSGPTQR